MTNCHPDILLSGVGKVAQPPNAAFRPILFDLAKNRNGPTHCRLHLFDCETTSFRSHP